MFRWIVFCMCLTPLLAQPELEGYLTQLSEESNQRHGELPMSFHVEKNRFGYVTMVAGFLTDEGDFETQAEAFIQQYGVIFGLSSLPFSTLQLEKASDPAVDPLPFFTFSQVHEGIPIYEGILSIHGTQQGAVFDVYSSLKPMTGLEANQISLQPTLAATQLETILQKETTTPIGVDLQGNPYPMEHAESLEMMSSPEITLYYHDTQDQWHLAYKVSYGGLEDYAEYLVDAHSGEMLQHRPLVHSLGDAAGQGTNSQGQVKNLQVWQYHSLLAPFPSRNLATGHLPAAQQLFDATFGQAMKTISDWEYVSIDASTPSRGNIFSTVFFGNTPLLVNAKTPNLDGSSANYLTKAGVDNQSNLRFAMDYFSNQHHWHSLDNKGTDILSLGLYGSNNAFFIPDLAVMATGAGSGSTQHFGSALDIVAHEFTHGVTHYRTASGLPYRNEAGAINEHISDLFGVMIQAESGNLDWTLGEDINYILRNFEHPHHHAQPGVLAGKHYFAPMTTPHRHNDFGGVHIMSGIPNRTIYLMAQGGQYQNYAFPAFDNSPQQALEKIAHLYFHAMPAMLPTIDFPGLFRVLYNTAVKLYLHDSQLMTYLHSLSGAWSVVGLKGDLLPGRFGDVEPNDSLAHVISGGHSRLGQSFYGALSPNHTHTSPDIDLYSFENLHDNNPFSLDLEMHNANTAYQVVLKQHQAGTAITLPLHDFRSRGAGYLAVLPKGIFTLEIKQQNWEWSAYEMKLSLGTYQSSFDDPRGILMQANGLATIAQVQSGSFAATTGLVYISDHTQPLVFFAGEAEPDVPKGQWTSGKIRIILQSLDTPGIVRSLELHERHLGIIQFPKNGFYDYQLVNVDGKFQHPDAQIYFGINSGGSPAPSP